MKKTFFLAALIAIVLAAFPYGASARLDDLQQADEVLGADSFNPATVEANFTTSNNRGSGTVSAGNAGGALSVDTSSCKRLTTDGASAIFSCFLGYLNYISIILLALAVFYTIYAAFKLVQSEEGRDEAKKTILWGIVAVFVMTSVWGLVNILANTFDVSSGNTAKSPVQLIK